MSVYIWPPVSVTTIPPMGGATSAKQDEQTAILQDILDQGAKLLSEFLYFDYVNDGPVTDAGYTTLIASTLADIVSMTWFESGGYPTVVAIGAAGLEVDLFAVPSGGFNGEIPVNIPAGSRVSIKELVSTTILPDTFIIANFYK